MIALLYAVVPAASLPVAPIAMTGVLQAEVNAHINGRQGVALLYSLFPQKRELPMPQSALEVHALVQKLLEHSGTIPFRLPAWLAKQEIASHLDSHAEAYRRALDRIADCVQMEIHLTSLRKPIAVSVAQSGREYLQSRAAGRNVLLNAAIRAREALDPVAREWRQHGAEHGTLKLAALVPRSKRTQFATLSAQLQLEGVAVRLSGPWPATDFIELNALQPAQQNGAA